MEYHLFAISPVEFQHGQMDPFGFETCAERVAQRYIPFSGTIRKPIYLLFIAYINWLLDHGLISAKGRKERDTAKIRLEKLLVTSWKRGRETLRGQGVIGSTIRHVNPFTGNDGNWVVQNCYKIYEASVREFDLASLVDSYHRDHKDQLPFLIDFLKRSGSLETNQRYLENLLERLRRKRSLFSGRMLLYPTYRRMMSRCLKDLIQCHEFGQDRPLIHKLFTHPQKAGIALIGVLKSRQYPFRELNDWFCAFTQAVDANEQGKETLSLWQTADSLFGRLSQKRGLMCRPPSKCWFDRDGAGYQKNQTFDKEGWFALVRRGNDPHRQYTVFRTTALASLLKELDPHAQ